MIDQYKLTSALDDLSITHSPLPLEEPEKHREWLIRRKLQCEILLRVLDESTGLLARTLTLQVLDEINEAFQEVEQCETASERRRR